VWCVDGGSNRAILRSSEAELGSESLPDEPTAIFTQDLEDAPEVIESLKATHPAHEESHNRKGSVLNRCHFCFWGNKQKQPQY